MLVLSPTRELSGQILESFRCYGRHLNITADADDRRRPDGSPGPRAHATASTCWWPRQAGCSISFERNALRLDRVEVLVLDEADRMLDMGFIHDIRTIVAKLPAKRQTLLFSATMPQAIAELATQMLHDPAKVAVTPSRPRWSASSSASSTSIARRSRRCSRTPCGASRSTARWSSSAPSTARTRSSRALVKSGIAAEAIHGNKSQDQRERVLAAFRDGRLRMLIATDIAARGIDVEGISHVINYDLPHVPETYVHRIGRTARAGAEGVAISFCSADEAPLLRAIEKLIRTSIPATGGRSAAAPVQRTERVPDRKNQRPRQHRGAAKGRPAAPTGSPLSTPMGGPPSTPTAGRLSRPTDVLQLRRRSLRPWRSCSAHRKRARPSRRATRVASHADAKGRATHGKGRTSRVRRGGDRGAA